MKYPALALACFLGIAYAQEKPPEKPPEGEKPAEEGKGEEEGETKKPEQAPPADPAKTLADLTLANAAKDVTRIDIAVKEAHAWAKVAKDEVMMESMAVELAEALHAAKGNWGTLVLAMEALGDLHSTKTAAKTLRRYATQKKVKDTNEEKLQATAVLGLGNLEDQKDIGDFEEISKSESTEIAKAAYTALGKFGTAKGKVRKQCAEILMKRLDMEYPSSGGQGGKTVSKEKQERWNQVSPAMVQSMKALCKEATINDIENWREWWKENKKNPKAEAWKDDES